MSKVTKALSDELAGMFSHGFLDDRMVDDIVAVVRKHSTVMTTALHPDLKVWIGTMPESNGKTNHTVILHRGDLTEGICVYRSEYPGRAQYEADAFRHLIGDKLERPCPTDYDSEAHSGYQYPKSALEIERDALRSQLETMTADRDAEKFMKGTAQGQRDALKAEVARLRAGGQVSRGEMERLEEWKRQVRENRR